MALKNMLEIKGGLYDLWEVRTIEPVEEYDTDKGEMKYAISLNREGIATNANALQIPFDDKETRDREMLIIKEKLSDMDIVVVH